MLRRRSLLAAPLLAAALPRRGWAQSAPLEVSIQRSEDGLRITYNTRLELPRVVDEALHKGVPLYFVAEVQVWRSRWYWRDATVARSSRQWRLAYQPLTRQYRLSTGGLHQGFDSLAEALALVAHVSGWLLELREEPKSDASYQLAFRLRLDTSQLPGPLQIGLGGAAQLDLAQERRVFPVELLPASARE